MDEMKHIDERVEKLLKKLQEKGAEDILINRINSLNKLVRYSNNKITISLANEEITLHVRLGYKKRILHHVINNIEFDVNEITSQLIKAANQLKEQEIYVSLPIKKFNYPPISKVDEKTKYSLEELNEIVEKAISKSLEIGINKVAGTLQVNIQNIKLITSTGNEVEDERSIAMLSHRAFYDKTSTGQWACCSRFLDNLNVEIAAEKASEIAKMNVKQVKIEPGKYDVIFSPMIFADLMEEVIRSSSAYSVDIGLSFFKNKLNTKVSSEKLTIYEDPLNENLAGFARFDDEGIPTSKKEIIKEGVLITYLHNLKTAKKFNTESTGNAGIVFPSPWNIIIKNGNYKEEELFKEVKKGLFIVNNWYLRYQNYYTGDFSTILRDGVFMIKNGEIVQALHGARLSENFLNLLNSIEALSKDVYPIKWWEVNNPTYTPYAFVKNQRITTAE